ncbi:MAG: NAD(P)-binding protein [Deltaproteobacteria bacterium]|nr:NAD(P)-binding protein [Deltaproteobacteria bacterium]
MKRIAILGAGPAALTAAWNLSEPGLAHEITIYTQGWRAGGLCASGRVGEQQWINQNGTHYIFGCYDATVGLLSAAYQVLAQKGDTRFGTLDAQLVPRDLLVIRQLFHNAWTDWVLAMPRRAGKPGRTQERIEPHESWEHITRGVFAYLRSDDMKEHLDAKVERASDTADGRGILAGIRRFVEAVEERLEGAAVDTLAGMVDEAARLFEQVLLALDQSGHDGPIDALADLLVALRDALLLILEPLGALSVTAVRSALLVDIGLTVVVGGLRDRAFTSGGLFALDVIDFRAWLTKHGARESSVWSAPISVWYDSIAAYRGGSQNDPQASTCATLIGYARLMTYAHAFAYQLSWEAGDSIIGPIVAALQHRGVRFAFFHRVWDVVPSADGARIDRVELEQQLALKSGDPLSYAPFLDSGAEPGRAVWPDQPQWDQISTPEPDHWVGGLSAELLHTLPLDPSHAPKVRPGLESSAYPRLGPTVMLEAGRDFDVVIGAMGLPVYGPSAPSLLAAWPALKTALATIGGGETQSLRFWFRPTLVGLGWTTQAPILSAYAAPFATWEDPTACLCSEQWPNDPPRTVAHLFGALEHAQLRDRPDTIQAQTTAAYLNASAWSGYASAMLWPGIASRTEPLAIDPSQVVAIQVRANVGLDQLYTQILPGTAAARPLPGATPFSNFVICGDWTRTPLLTGTLEGAVESGVAAAGAV